MNKNVITLNKELHQQYDEAGYLLLNNLLDQDTVTDLSRAADELAESFKPITNDDPRIQVDRIDNCLKIRKIEPLIDISETFAQLSRDQRIMGVMTSIFGEPPVLFEDKLNYKLPKGGSAFSMHQDYSYWTEFSPRLTTILIYIDDATEENGCMEIVPGHHKNGLLKMEGMKVGENIDYVIPENTLDRSQVVKAPAPAGSALIFSCFTPHASAPNFSGKARRAIIFTYNPVSDGDSYGVGSGKLAIKPEIGL
jgi:2-aminoethylphosphonate dioxygenase